jgi:cytochrome c oxidase subunit I+III
MIEGLALYLLPKLLGARDLAFPRLSAFGYWCYLFGGSILILALLVGAAPDAGWFMYTPLSSKPYTPGINSDVWLIGVTFVEVSAVCAAVEFMATVLKVRTAGMALQRMPILVWYLWVTAAMMLFGFPPLILGSVLLEVERAFDWPFFDPLRGGDPLLWQHLFWLFGHPEVYIIFLPGAGVISTLIPVFAGRPLVGYAWIVCAIVALAFLSFGLWVHHMFATGIPHLSLAFFSAASTLVAVPTAVQVFAWLATLLGGRPRLRLPMLWVFGFLFVFVTGGLTGVMVALVPFDLQAHDTHFIVAHLHYVLIGGFVFPMVAAGYYWLPHLTGRRHTEGLGVAAFWLTFLGMNLTFLPMHLTGLLGMPRRVYTYAPGLGWDGLNLASSIGGFVMAIGFGLVLVDVIAQTRFGPRTFRNPWKAGTLDWAMALPPPSYNLASLPTVADRDPLASRPDLPARLAAGEGLLATPRNGWRETLGVHMLTGKPEQVILLPGPTWIPLFTALATGGFFVAFLFKLYWLAALSLAAVVACAWRWLWASGLRLDLPPVDIGNGETAPLHPMSEAPPSLWGMIFTLMANGTFFASLIFGYAFLWVVAPNWPPPALIAPNLPILAIAAFSLAGGVPAAALAARANRQEDKARRTIWLGAALVLNLAAVAAFLAIAALAPSPRAHAYGAAVGALCLYGALQNGIGALICAYAGARAARGWISTSRGVEFRALGLWQGYASASGGVVLAALYAPLAGGGA